MSCLVVQNILNRSHPQKCHQRNREMSRGFILEQSARYTLCMHIFLLMVKLFSYQTETWKDGLIEISIFSSFLL